MLGATIEMEKTRERTGGKFIARLGDLGLGSPEGIPSRYAHAGDDELNEIAAKFAERLQEPTDLTAIACIDGRERLANADGSDPEIRLRRVGGSASNLGVALNAEAPIVDTLEPDSDLGMQITTVDGFVKELTGFDRSAHLGGCGGANGEIDDDEAIKITPAILAATKAFMDIPEVLEDLGVGYDDALGERVRVSSGKTAQLLKAGGWDGQKYVEGVVEANPRAVEDLEVDHDDKEFYGHRENSLVVIIGKETLKVDNEFVWNLEASKKVAEAFAGQRGREGYVQALIAEIAKHMAVANRLPGKDTPIFLLVRK